MQTKKKTLINLIPVIIICLLSLTSLVNFSENTPPLAGLATTLGPIYFFIYKRRMKLSRVEANLNEKTFIEDIKKNWLIVIVPSILGLVSIGLSKLIMPDFVDHVIGRVAGLLALDKMVILVFQFILFAFIEEIVWRALIQKRLALYMKAPYAIIISSLFFAIAHTSLGNISIVTYDLFFVFCSSIFYGIVFHKTKSTYASAFSHFLANLSGSIFFLYFL